MNILTNLPFECFEPRQNFEGVRLVTYGPTHRTWVDGVFYPPDVTFDPSTGTIEELFARLPADFTPDLLLIYWPDQDPIPVGLERCPIPVAGVLSDYNLTLPYVVGLWPFFDAWLVDRGGVELFERLSFANPNYFCQFSYKAPSHRIYEGEARSIDIGFAGNLNPVVQRDRVAWVERLRRLAERGVHVEIPTGLVGESYGRFLNRCRIGFNRSVRGEMNLRAFEVPACGALLLMESENKEVRDFFVPGEEVVLYDDGNFEDVVTSLLADDAELQRIAANGHRRVQDFAMSKRLRELCEIVAPVRVSRPQATDFERSLGRGVSMLSSWVSGEPVLAELQQAHELAPEDPRPLNAMAVAWMTKTTETRPQEACDLLVRATQTDPGYAVAALNLCDLLTRAEQPANARRLLEQAKSALSSSPDWSRLDGPLLAPCYSEPVVNHASALASAVLAGKPDALMQHWS